MNGVLGNLTIPELVQVLRAKGFSPEWEQAVVVASQTATEEDFRPLVALLNDSETSVRQQAAHVLAKLDNPHAVKLLVEKALASHDEHIERAAVAALMHRRESAVQLLQDVMEGSSGLARIVAALILAESGHSNSLQVLLDALDSPEKSDGVTSLLPRILDVLGNLRDVRAVPCLAGFLHQDHRLLRLVAARSLVKIGEPAVEALLEIAKNDKYELDARCRAVETLGQIGSPSAVHPLVKLLDDDQGPIQREVIKALGRIGGTASVEALMRILKGRDALKYGQACKALIKTGQLAVPSLVRLLAEHPSPGARRCIADALGQIGDASAIPGLVGALKDKNSLVRKAAADALGQLKDPSAVDSLCQLLEQDNWFVARGAAEALARIGDARAIGPLLRGLKIDRSEIREQIVKSLGSFHTTLSEMIAASQSQNGKDQCDCCDDLTGRVIVDLLANVLHDDEPMVRINAARLLVRLKGELVEKRIETILQDCGPGAVELRQALLELEQSDVLPQR